MGFYSWDRTEIVRNFSVYMYVYISYYFIMSKHWEMEPTIKKQNKPKDTVNYLKNLEEKKKT